MTVSKDKLEEERKMEEMFESITKTLSKDAVELFKKLGSDNDWGGDITRDAEAFYYRFGYNFESFVEGFARTMVKDNSDVAWIYQHYHFIELQFNHVYKKFEGSSCCADKSRGVVQRLLEFYITGKEIHFDPKSKYTYGHPKKYLKTHEEIVEFYQAVQSLYYGNPLKYMQIYHLIVLEENSLNKSTTKEQEQKNESGKL